MRPRGAAMKALQPASAHSGRTSDQSRLRWAMSPSPSARGRRSARSPLVTLPAAASQAPRLLERCAVVRRRVVVGVDRHRIGGGVVQGAQEERVRRDLDAARRQAGPDLGIIQQRGQQPRIDLARIAAAGAAMQAAGMRVVHDIGAMPGEEDQAARSSRSATSPAGRSRRRSTWASRSSTVSSRGAGSTGAFGRSRPSASPSSLPT